MTRSINMETLKMSHHLFKSIHETRQLLPTGQKVVTVRHQRFYTTLGQVSGNKIFTLHWGRQDFYTTLGQVSGDKIYVALLSVSSKLILDTCPLYEINKCISRKRT